MSYDVAKHLHCISMSESMINLLHKLDSVWSNPVPYILILETLEISFHREIIIIFFVSHTVNNNRNNDIIIMWVTKGGEECKLCKLNLIFFIANRKEVINFSHGFTVE